MALCNLPRRAFKENLWSGRGLAVSVLVVFIWASLVLLLHYELADKDYLFQPNHHLGEIPGRKDFGQSVRIHYKQSDVFREEVLVKAEQSNLSIILGQLIPRAPGSRRPLLSLPVKQELHRNQVPTVSMPELTTKRSKKRILLIGSEVWPHLDPRSLPKCFDICEYKECEVTYDKAILGAADAVLFRANDLQLISERLVRDRKVGQIWVLYVLETPDNGEIDKSGVFHWLMSYKSRSDIVSPYGQYIHLSSLNMTPPTPINYAQGKTSLAFWSASNCVGFRVDFVRQLMQYIPVTVVGQCAANLPTWSNATDATEACSRRGPVCDSHMQTYKFYFSFENTFCEDYVTEKYWHSAIELGLVPVVMGATYTSANSIPGSYIDANSFSSIRELANYLKYLDKNDAAYSKYFAWKQTYRSVGHEKMCRLCKALHTRGPSPPYERIWSSTKDCRIFDWRKEHITRLINEDKKITSN